MSDRAFIPRRAGGRNARAWTTPEGIASGGGGAFTLIEVMAAIVIVALLAGLAGLSLRGVLRSAESDQATRQLLAYDAQTRQRAARFDRPIQLSIREDRIEQEPMESPGATETRNLPTMSGTPGLLPTGHQIDRVVTADGSDTRAEVVVTASAGTARSRSYGLRLVDGEREQQQWVIVCGPTGMGTVVDDDRQAQNILAILALARLPELPGADAD